MGWMDGSKECARKLEIGRLNFNGFLFSSAPIQQKDEKSERYAPILNKSCRHYDQERIGGLSRTNHVTGDTSRTMATMRHPSQKHRNEPFPLRHFVTIVHQRRLPP